MRIYCKLFKMCADKDCLIKTEQYISRFYLRSIIAGHTSLCKECHKKSINKWRKANPKKYAEYCKTWEKRNPEIVKASQKKYWDKNPLKLKSKWANHQIKRKYSNKFKLTSEQKLQIRSIYENCPKGYEVDHIVPLLGKNVMGFHVPWNLQYLTAEENRIKSNKFIQGNQ